MAPSLGTRFGKHDNGHPDTAAGGRRVVAQVQFTVTASAVRKARHRR
ncbi:MAG: hypothetical protein JSS45_13860 [Proteobacteria bacterium]|nr:hypothetical protein [Pseudomonadota bacterium]